MGILDRINKEIDAARQRYNDSMEKSGNKSFSERVEENLKKKKEKNDPARIKKRDERTALVIAQNGIPQEKIVAVANGSNGQLVLTENAVIIGREGFSSKMIQGWTQGGKVIPLAAIQSVEIKPSGLTAGYIQFTLAGGMEPHGGVMAAINNENAVTFHNEDEEDFRVIRDKITARMF